MVKKVKNRKIEMIKNDSPSNSKEKCTKEKQIKPKLLRKKFKKLLQVNNLLEKLSLSNKSDESTDTALHEEMTKNHRETSPETPINLPCDVDDIKIADEAPRSSGDSDDDLKMDVDDVESSDDDWKNVKIVDERRRYSSYSSYQSGYNSEFDELPGEEKKEKSRDYLFDGNTQMSIDSVEGVKQNRLFDFDITNEAIEREQPLKDVKITIKNINVYNIIKV